jgi:SAM-dependent methyltransferase
VSRGNKDHWYDGRFYDLLLAPSQDRAFVHVRNFIPVGSTVLDLGCGTGRLAFQLAHKCGSIDGVDPSARNIEVARRKLSNSREANVRFHHAYAEEFLEDSNARFDYATVSLVMHEIDAGERVGLLRALSPAARHLIFVDYLVPRPGDCRKVLNEAVEFAAGPEHYRNFKSFVAGNGLHGVIAGAGLCVEREIRNDPPSIHVVQAGPCPSPTGA